MAAPDILRIAAEATGADPITALLQYGVLGVFASVLLLYTRSSIAREREKGDRAEQQVKELNDFIRNELLPKQVEATILHKRVAEVLGDAVNIISDLKYREEQREQRGGRRGT
jgi:hypothetical protein